MQSLAHPRAAAASWQARLSAARLLRSAPTGAGYGPLLRRPAPPTFRSTCRRAAGSARAAVSDAETSSVPAAGLPATTEEQRQQQQKREGGGEPDAEHEPEVALILVACGIGLATGASIVAFNDAVHAIRDFIWHHESLLASTTSLRNISESELWPKVVFPPVAGGLLVGALGLLVGGYTGSKKPKPPPASSGGSAGGSMDRAGSSAAGAAGSASISGASSSSDSDDGASRGGAKALDLERIQAVMRPVARAVGAAVTLGTGASLGPEGPSVDIGRSWAKGLGSRLKSQEQHLVRLLAAGSGAGVAAGFNAPIAGVFFAVETVLQRQKPKPIEAGGSEKSAQGPNGLTVAMILLASVLAAVVSAAGLGSSPAFRVPAYRLESLYELPLYLAFGALCGLVSASFSYSTRVASQAFAEVREQNSMEAVLLPCIGGLTTGVLALGYPEILYQGFDNVNTILSSGNYAPGLLVQIVVMKIIATSICRGSGLQGGIYAPSIFIGAALGSAFGQMAHVVGDPAGLLLSAPQAYALVGVAAMLASNCQVPLTSVLLLFELTRDYLIIVPTLAAVGISFWVSSQVGPSTPSFATLRQQAMAAMAAARGGGPPGALAEGLGLRDESDMLDGVSSDPRVAKERVEAVKRQIEEVLHLGEEVLHLPRRGAAQQAQQQQHGEAGEHAAASGGGGGGAAAPGGSVGAPLQLAGPASAWPRPQLPEPLGSLAAVVATGGEGLPLLLPVEMAPEDALDLMEREQRGVAVVVGKDGGVAGVVTLRLLRECLEAQGAGAEAPADVGSLNGSKEKVVG